MSRFTTGLSELVLIVGDVLAAARFYEDVVGLEPVEELNEHWAWFTAGPNQRVALHRGSLLYEEHSPYPEGDRWGRVHFALETPRGKLEAAVAHLRDHGVEVYGPESLDWMDATSYYFYDLDGNLLEFWSPER